MALEKKYEPTKKKLTKARRDGDVSRAKELTAAVALTICISCIFLFTNKFKEFQILSEENFSSVRDFSYQNMVLFAKLWLKVVVGIFWVIICPLLVGVFAIELLQVGPGISTKALGCDFSRLSFSAGLKRITGGSAKEYFSEILKTLSATLICIVFIVWSLWLTVGSLNSLTESLNSVNLNEQGYYTQVGNSFIRNFLFNLLSPILAISAILGLVFYWLERRKRRRRLMMDENEFRQEFRESEGDPHIRASRRQQHQEIALYGLTEKVRRAKVLVVGKQ
ncbi:EscU/YscU/HrcU family type III secretion system export apparatus switch protein [bacterium]|nr:EscU/YscU/HrcU family type III secretion system export apparatus switch protein [bacterium]